MKIRRQLILYDYILSTKYHGPKELMERFGIGKRMLQRDLKDLRDSGLINLRYDKEDRNYVCAEDEAVLDKDATGRHRQHLIRLNRLGTLITKLPRMSAEEIRSYEMELEEYEYYRDELACENPDEFPLEDLWESPEMPDFPDVKAAYYELFPDCTERTRQRDFEELSGIGFRIYYSRKYKAFIFEEDEGAREYGNTSF